MKRQVVFWLGMVCCFMWPLAGMATVNTEMAPGTAHTQMTEIVRKVEDAYSQKGTEMRFVQTSVIKAMDISDTAAGKITIKPPGMMRWEYETPDPQLIITNGKKLWLYRPEDRQVMVGDAAVFFGNGKGAGFLSDITTLKDGFDISMETSEEPGIALLKLVPRDQNLDVAYILLYVLQADGTLQRIITYNAYGDETRVDLFDPRFNLELDDTLFNFVIPEQTDIIKLDQ